MADDDKSQSTSSDEGSLDATSENFNPLKALYSKNVRIPNPEAPVHDNIHKYKSSLVPRAKKEPMKESSDAPGPSTSSEPARRFLPHQEPIRKPRPQKTMRTVLTRMDTITGPLALLKDCMERRVRIKVYTRHMTGVRGYCIAFVTAFDKHWNMALEDVSEVWTRRKRNKVPALGIPSREVVSRVQRPRVLILRTEGKMETCERHVHQLLVRGEQVALIAILNPA